MAKRVTGEHAIFCKANEGNVDNAHLFIYVCLPWALHVIRDSVCISGTENQRTFQLRVTVVTVSVETMNHKYSTWDELWQYLTCVTMCHVTWVLPWWGSMFRKCVKTQIRHPAIFLSSPAHECILKSTAENVVIGFLSRVMLEGEKSERKWSTLSPMSVWRGTVQAVGAFKLIFNSFVRIWVDCSKWRKYFCFHV